MKFTSVIILALLSTALASPIYKRAADAATQKANAQDAITLNNQFASIKSTDPCTSGTSACVNGGFAQCVNSKWSITQCAAGTQCFALPLVNKRGTSLTCDTAADKDARIAAAGGSSGATPPAPTTPTPATPATPPKGTSPAPTTPATPPATGSGDIASIRKQNAIDAQALQTKFNSLNANSPCTDGENACVNGQFAQCSGGKFALTPCAGGTQCFVLPLVNKAGTSTTCDTQADRDARFAAAQSGQS